MLELAAAKHGLLEELDQCRKFSNTLQGDLVKVDEELATVSNTLAEQKSKFEQKCVDYQKLEDDYRTEVRALTTEKDMQVDQLNKLLNQRNSESSELRGQLQPTLRSLAQLENQVSELTAVTGRQQHTISTLNEKAREQAAVIARLEDQLENCKQERDTATAQRSTQSVCEHSASISNDDVTHGKAKYDSFCPSFIYT